MKRTRSDRSRGFTLIELVIVMSIIIVLAGLILATSGYVQEKSKRSRTEAEIAAISAALENYKADNGIYPKEAATDDLDAKSPSSADPATYADASFVLYRELPGKMLPEIQFLPPNPISLSNRKCSTGHDHRVVRSTPCGGCEIRLETTMVTPPRTKRILLRASIRPSIFGAPQATKATTWRSGSKIGKCLCVHLNLHPLHC